MTNREIGPSNSLHGRITLPGDKSISHRAVMLGAIARGETVVRGLLDCDDCNYTIDAFRSMGVEINKGSGQTVIRGVGLHGLKKPEGSLYAGESGTTMRILPGILAGQSFDCMLEGAESLSRRPMKRVVEPLRLMGVDIEAGPQGYPPIKIRGGRVKAIDYKMDIPSAQVKSAVLFAALHAEGITNIEEMTVSRDHTERMMRYFGADIHVDSLKISLSGARELAGKPVDVPGDFSSASFFIVAAILVNGSRITIERVGINPTRAGLLKIVSRMGAKCRIVNRTDGFEPSGDIEIEYSPTTGTVIEPGEIAAVIDELPILFVLASFSQGKTVIKGASELRVKETDRISSMKENLEKMGGHIEVSGDDITITGMGRLQGAELKSFGDHRTCMAMAVAALAALGPSSIDDIGCVSKSFPGFFGALETLSA